MKGSITVSLAALGMTIASCSVATKPVGASSLTTMRNDVYAASVGYNAVLVAVVAYNNLPRCGNPASPPICSDKAVIDQIRTSANVANTAIQNAEDLVRGASPDMTIAAAAVAAAKAAETALETAASQLGVKH